MRDSHRSSVARGGALAAALAAFLAPTAAHAQYIHNDAPPLPVAPAAGTYESPSDKLARNVRILAQQPKNLPALLAAGRASLALGDIPSAEGFFGRADEINPNDPAPKIGMAGAAVLNGNLDEAQSWFGQAQRLGAPQSLLGTDRGLLLDLKGDLGAAQSDYRAALAGPDPDEARRRYALSLAMGGRMDDGLKILEPLLRQRDPAALRIRAFVLALGGQKAAAVSAIEQAMPGAGGRVAPFFDTLPVLSIAQKAAAVHLGIFPSEAEVRLAMATTPSRTSRSASPAPVRASRSSRSTPQPQVKDPERPLPSWDPPNIKKGFFTTTTGSKSSPPAAIAGTQSASTEPAPISPAPSRPAFAQPAPANVAEAPRPGFDLPSVAESSVSVASSPIAVTSDRLSAIDRLLSETHGEPLPPPPPPPRPKVEKADASTTKSPKSSSTSVAKRKADADAKKAAADAKKKADAEARALGVAGTTWVQLAGGSNADRMATEYKRIKAKKPALFAKHPGHVTQGKDYFRLVVGPFDDTGDARDFVNSLAKAGIDSFMWTRSPPTIHIDKLPSK